MMEPMKKFSLLMPRHFTPLTPSHCSNLSLYFFSSGIDWKIDGVDCLYKENRGGGAPLDRKHSKLECERPVIVIL